MNFKKKPFSFDYNDPNSRQRFAKRHGELNSMKDKIVIVLLDVSLLFPH